MSAEKPGTGIVRKQHLNHRQYGLPTQGTPAKELKVDEGGYFKFCPILTEETLSELTASEDGCGAEKHKEKT